MPSQQLNSPAWPGRAALLGPWLCLALSIVVYSTALNPGLPLLLACGTSAIFCLWRLLLPGRPYYHPGLDIVLAAILWAALCSSTALDPYLAQRSLATLVGGGGIVLGLVCAVRTSSDWKLAAYSFVGLTAAASLLAWPAALQAARATGTLPALKGSYNNPDAFSILPLAGFCLGFGLLARGRGAWTGAMLAVLGGLAVTLAATGCRSAMLGGAVGLALFFALLATHRSRRLRKARPLMMALPLVVVMALLPLSNFGLSGIDKVGRTLSDPALRNEATRLEVATTGWRAVLGAPLLGAGPGCFGLAYQTVRPTPHPDDYINLAHNDHLEIAVELGLPGLLLWAGLLLAALHKTYDALVHGRRPAEAAGLVAALTALIVFAFFNFILAERPSFWAQCYLLGLAYAFPSDRAARAEPVAARFGLTLPILLLSLWGVAFAARQLQADALAATARSLAAGLRFEESAQVWDQAVAVQPQRVAFRQSRAEVARKLVAMGFAQQAPTVQQNLQDALRISRANTGVMVQLALWSARRGDNRQAAELLERALALDPGSPSIERRRQELQLRQGHWNAAATGAWANFEKSGQGLPALAELVIAAELQNPGQGCALLRSWSSEPSPRVTLLWSELLAQTEARNLGPAQLNFALLKIEMTPADLCARLALFRLEAGSEEQRFASLGQALAEASVESTASPCFSQALLGWSSLGSKLGKSPAVKARLADTLRENPRLDEVRVHLAGLLVDEGERAEAIALLKEGLAANNSSLPLHLGLARLYKQSGSAELSRAYARDALRLDPTSREAKSLLQ